ncbi:MAG: glycosyltransferase family 4 protein [Chloroflexota bacterium]
MSDKDAGLHPRILITRSNPIAPDPRVEKEARSLARAGYPVSVLGWDRSGSLPTQENVEGVLVQRLSIRSEYARGLMNFFPLLRWEVGLLAWLVRKRNDYDILHSCDFDTVLPALLCKILFGKKVVYDIFDFYADHLRATPGWIKRLIRSVDLWAINRADAVILVDDARREQIAGPSPRRLAVIYNSPEDPGDQPAPAAHAGVELRLAYIGLLQVERGLLDVLEVLRRHPQWTLDLAGFGGDEARILEIAAQLPNVNWHGRVPYQATLALSAQADVLFALYDPAIPNHRFSSPNKLFEAMLLGKPVVVARDTNMDRLVEEHNFGLVVQYGNLSEIEAAFTHLAQDPGFRQQAGSRARQSYDQHFGWHVMEQKLIELYRQI